MNHPLNETMPGVTKQPTNGNRSRDKVTRVLLAEDDVHMRRLLALALRHRGYDVSECRDGMSLADEIGSAVLLEETEAYDLVVSDIRLPGVTGLEILEGLSALPDLPPFLLITAFGDRETHEAAERLGAAALLDKPFEIDEFVAVVDEILEDRAPRC